MGGDIENTHFVKGLDRTLLNKVRGQLYGDQEDEKKSNKTMNHPVFPDQSTASTSLPPGIDSSNTIPNPMMQDLKPRYRSIGDVPTKTLFGKRIQGFFLQQEMRKKEQAQMQMKKDSKGFVAPSPFALITYKYHMRKRKDKKGKEDDATDTNEGDNDKNDGDNDDDDFSDLPELPEQITRSKQEAKALSGEKLCNYIMPPALLDKVEKAFANFRLRGEKPRKKRDREERSQMRQTHDNRKHKQASDEIQQQKLAKKPVVDTVGDIFADVGKYDPIAAIERVMQNAEKVDEVDKVDIFGGLRAETTEEMQRKENEKDRRDDADRMIEKLSASTVKQGDKVRSYSAPMVDESKKIHRDIFGGQSDEKKKREKERKGDKFLEGSYDHNTFENPYDDDDDDVGNDSDDDGAAASRRPKTVQEVMKGNKDQNWAF